MHRSSSVGGRQGRPLSSAEKAELREKLRRDIEATMAMQRDIDKRLEAILADGKAWEKHTDPKVLVRVVADDFHRNGTKYERGALVEFPPLAAECWQEYGKVEIVKDWRVPCADGRVKKC